TVRRNVGANQKQYQRKCSRNCNKQERQCKYCNYKHRIKKEECPAFRKTCNLCKQEIHFAVKFPKS
ncbi:hypothetical protein LSH36_864g00000, partial [Paralvinella palmiformis]